MKDDNPVGMLDGRKAMGNDEGGSSLEQPFQTFLNQPFGLRVHMGGGLVKDEDFGIGSRGLWQRPAVASPRLIAFLLPLPLSSHIHRVIAE